MISLTRRALMLALPVGLAACDVLPKSQPPPKLYTLTPARDFPPSLPTVNKQLLIDVPVAAGATDTERIALMKTAVTLDYFADAAWTDRAPVLVQSLLVESFENSGKIGAIGRDTVALRADYVLTSELRDFTAIYGAGGAPTVHVRLGVKLVRMDDRRIVGQRQFEAAEAAKQDAIIPVVDAFDAALRHVMTEIVTWTLPAIAHA